MGGAATTVGREIARTLGVSTPEQAEERIRTDPKAVESLQRLEDERGHEWLPLALAEQEAARKLMEAEQQRGFFHHGWRPAFSWLVGWAWLQNMTISPIAWSFGLTLGTIPWEHLLALTGIWLAIYSGGHTAKSIFGNRFAR